MDLIIVLLVRYLQVFREPLLDLERLLQVSIPVEMLVFGEEPTIVPLKVSIKLKVLVHLQLELQLMILVSDVHVNSAQLKQTKTYLQLQAKSAFRGRFSFVFLSVSYHLKILNRKQSLLVFQVKRRISFYFR